MRFLDLLNAKFPNQYEESKEEDGNQEESTQEIPQEHNLNEQDFESENENRLDLKNRYLQIAFNQDLLQVLSILHNIPQDKRILIEAGTPFIKREGMQGVLRISQIWDGYIIADMKTVDGAEYEVDMAADAGASAITALGTAPIETLNLFIKRCKERGIDSMIDLLGVQDPLKVLLKLSHPPDVLVLHKGRDEENTRGKVIPYKQVNKIRSKYSTLISAAGGVDLREARSAIFNGSNIVVVNIVSSDDVWKGIDSNDDVAEIAMEFLKTIK